MEAIYSLPGAFKLDKTLIKNFNLDERELIKGAARKAYEKVKSKVLGKKVLFLIGPGNNGSDGLEMAYLLSRENLNVSLFFFSESGNEINTALREKYSFLPRAFSFDGYEVIVDALFGFSFREEIGRELEEIINLVNSTSAYVISLDLPSCLKIRADETITFTTYKLPFYLPSMRFLMGNIKLVNPGFPCIEDSEENTYLLSGSDYIKRDFKITDYKTSRGHLAIIGGSEKFKGAPLLSSRAAFHAGVGLVSLASCEDVLLNQLEKCPSIIGVKENELNVNSYNAFVVGPGWDEGNEVLLNKVIESGKPFLIDADGIKLLKGKRLGANSVITPHIGEYRKLCSLLQIDDGLSSPERLKESLYKISTLLETNIVLKSSTVWFWDVKGKLLIYDGVNPSLGVAGSGDVLSGIIGALISEGEKIITAIRNGIIIHQEAGKKAHEKYGYYSAEDLIGEIRI